MQRLSLNEAKNQLAKTKCVNGHRPVLKSEELNVLRQILNLEVGQKAGRKVMYEGWREKRGCTLPFKTYRWS